MTIAIRTRAPPTEAPMEIVLTVDMELGPSVEEAELDSSAGAGGVVGSVCVGESMLNRSVL